MRRRGFTLIELLVTMAIIAVLATFTVGVVRSFGKKNELEATTYAVRSLLRRARNASQEERYGAVVTVDPTRSELRAQLRSAITRFRFEPDTTAAPAPADPADDDEPVVFTSGGARGFVMNVEEAVPAVGRYGQALLFDGEGAWAFVDDRPVLSPLEGVHLQAWVYLGDLRQTLYDRAPRRDPRQNDRYARAGTPPRPTPERLLDYDPNDPPVYHVMRKGRAYGLAVTASYELEVFVTGVKAGAEVTWISRTQAGTLAPERWYRLAMAFDGRALRVLVDGIARYHAPLVGHDTLPERLVRDPSPLSLSDSHPDRGFFGVIDELEVAAVVSSEALPIPKDVALVAPADEVHFDLLGQLDPARHAEPFTFFLSDDLEAFGPAQEAARAASQGTRTRAQAEEERRNLALGLEPYERFLRIAPDLPPTRVSRITVERTGLVR